MRLGWTMAIVGILGVGCAGVDVDDDGDTDGDTVETDVAHDTGDAHTDVDDTDVVSACGVGAPVTVTATVDKGWLVEDADVRWFLLDGRSGTCDRVPPPDAWDRWTCDAPLDGDLWVTVTHPFLRGYTEVVRAGIDGCRDGGEALDGSHALSPAGPSFPESRVYAFRRYDDDETCEHAFELYGQSCYATTYFCADGHAVVLQTDIFNEGAYAVDPDGTVHVHLFPEGDVPKDTTWTPVAPDTLRAWDGGLWVRRDDFAPWPCPEWVPMDTGLDVETDSDPDTDVDTDVDTDLDTDTDVGPVP